MSSRWILALMLLVPVVVAADVTNVGRGEPWGEAIQTLNGLFSNNFLRVIALLGLFIAGYMLIWGAEVGEFARRLVMFVFSASLLLSANEVLKLLFDVGGS